MTPTIRGISGGGTARHLVAFCSLMALWPPPLSAQAEAWRTHFQAGDAARAEGDHRTYAEEMAAAVSAMPAGRLNRPFLQYHAARAHVLAGLPGEAAHFLRMAWEEDIEKLMISFAEHDPAFEAVRDDDAYREVMGRAAEMELTVSRLGGSVYLLQGAGSNVLASVGDDGVLLVDTGYGAALPALRRAVADLGATLVARVIVTHPHEDHWGMTPDLGDEAEIWAHPGTAVAMAEPYTFIDGVVLEAKPERARPVLEVTEGSYWFNEDVEIFQVSAHTGADLAVHFPSSGVLHLGDAYLGGNPMMFPGSQDPDGFLNRLERRLADMDEGTVVVGGHDGPVGLPDVLDQIRETRACMSLVRRALADGRTLEEAVSSAGTRFPPQWVGYFYRLLAAPGVDVME